MDIAATSILAQQLMGSQQQMSQAMMRQSAKAEQQAANIIMQAVEAAGSADGQRGTQLDITV